MRANVKRRIHCGFTLIELVVAITVSAVVVGFMAMFIVTPMNAYFAQTRRAELVDGAELAMRNLADDLRNATPGNLSVTTGSIEVLDIGPGAVVYVCDEGAHTLRRNVAGAPSALLARDIQTCTFAYNPAAPLPNQLVSLSIHLSRAGENVTDENLHVFQQLRVGQ